MLPVLFTLTLPAAWLKPFALAVLVALALARAWAFRRRLAQGGKRPGWRAALWDDKATLALLVLAVAALWKTGLLDADLALPLHTYGLMIATGFVTAIWLAQREARKQGQDAERIGDLAFWVLVSAIIGSRLYFIAVNWPDYFGENAWMTLRGTRVPRLLAIWEGGLVFYGGFIGAALTAWWYLRRHGMRFLPHADTIIPSVSIGHFFGRLGCFAAGCCWGAVSHEHLPWLAKFPPASLAYQTFSGRVNAAELLTPDRMSTMPVHPTQLYESLGELVLFALLALVVRPNKRFHGQVLASWLMGYAVLRTVVELFRGDVERGVVAGLGVGQWTSMVVFAAGVVVWVIGHCQGARVRAARTVLAA